MVHCEVPVPWTKNSPLLGLFVSFWSLFWFTLSACVSYVLSESCTLPYASEPFKTGQFTFFFLPLPFLLSAFSPFPRYP